MTPVESTRSVAVRRTRSVLAALAAALVYGLLVDAAVETFQAESPIRLFVAIPVALYVSFSLWLIRAPRTHRPGPESAAWVSAFLFLGILAVTVSVPGGLDAGVRVANQPTSSVLIVVSGLVILLAASTLTLGHSLPWWTRVLAGAGAGYGLAALVIGLLGRTSYVSLLQGGSWWPRFPYWAQGAFVGTMLVVPAAFILEVLVALKHVRLKGRTYRIVAFALGVWIAYAAFTAAR